MQVINSDSARSMTVVEPVRHLAEPRSEEIEQIEAGLGGLTATMLWAIQAWYLQLNDGTNIEKALARRGLSIAPESGLPAYTRR